MDGLGRDAPRSNSGARSCGPRVGVGVGGDRDEGVGVEAEVDALGRELCVLIDRVLIDGKVAYALEVEGGGR